MLDRSERLRALREKLATCEAEADALGLEVIGFLIAFAIQELDTQSRNLK